MKKYVLLISIVLVVFFGAFYVFWEMNKKEESHYELISASNLNEIIETRDYFVLFVKQDGCFSCDQVEPLINELSLSKEFKIFSIIINREANTNIFEDLNIEVTPTVIFFYDGKEIDRIEGEFDEETLMKTLRK